MSKHRPENHRFFRTRETPEIPPGPFTGPVETGPNRPLRALLTAAIMAIGLSTIPGAAQQVIVVSDDRGGRVNAQATHIDQIIAAGARVEIRGSICLSACTMYLGAGNVCVSPQTTFGFHGPSNNGAPLAPDRFDHWSRVMARYYNAPLSDWFMSQARYDLTGYRQMSGADLIRLGYQSC